MHPHANDPALTPATPSRRWPGLRSRALKSCGAGSNALCRKAVPACGKHPTRGAPEITLAVEVFLRECLVHRSPHVSASSAPPGPRRSWPRPSSNYSSAGSRPSAFASLWRRLTWCADDPRGRSDILPSNTRATLKKRRNYIAFEPFASRDRCPRRRRARSELGSDLDPHADAVRTSTASPCPWRASAQSGGIRCHGLALGSECVRSRPET